MLRTLSLVAVLVVICGATHIQYPVSGQPCILMDVQSDNTLVWTDKDKKQTPVPRWNLNSSTVNSGGCDPNPYVTVRWPDDASFTFTFSKSATMVNLEMAFSIIPNHIAEFNKSTDGERLTAKKSMMLGSDTKAFVCDEMAPIELIMPGKNGDVYTATINFKSFKAQGFNVVNGQYSEAEECDDTKSTIQTGKPMTEQTPEPQTTEHKPSEPPATTVKTTEHTTKHTTEHTTEHTTKQTTKHTTEHTTEHTTKHTTEHTTEPPTTKPVPSTKAPIVPGNHPSVTVKLDANGVNCFYMVGEILFTVPYTKMDNTNTTVGVGLQDINRVSGTCNGTNHTNIVNIQFLDDWMLDITVSTDGSTLLMDDSDKSFWISELKLNYTYRADIMKDLNASMVNKRAIASAEGTLFKASRQSSYLCNANTGTSMSNGVSLNTYNFQYDAFSTSKNQTKFDGDPTQCSADEKTNSIVPIAVGAALAGLVVIVLIAYLIGRRRNRKGYESV